jgi:hypothetical protein
MSGWPTWPPKGLPNCEVLLAQSAAGLVGGQDPSPFGRAVMLLFCPPIVQGIWRSWPIQARGRLLTFGRACGVPGHGVLITPEPKFPGMLQRSEGAGPPSLGGRQGSAAHRHPGTIMRRSVRRSQRDRLIGACHELRRSTRKAATDFGRRGWGRAVRTVRLFARAKDSEQRRIRMHVGGIK